ncbi:MAG: AEC family transporter [Pseudomonadales bacterium]|nr:AEC family transporter [Pseudomonadales bacterium]
MLVTALTPIFAIILIGFCLSRLPLFSQSVWADVKKLTYYLFFPALLVLRLSESRFDWDEITDITLVIGLSLIVVTVLFVALHNFIAGDLSTLSSVYQGTIRFNTYIGLALIEALYGDRGITVAALCIAVYIPLVNVLSVASLSLQGESSAKRVFIITGAVVTNPLVIACLTGLAISFGGYNLPNLLRASIEILSQPALPLGLLAVGAGIRFIALGEQTWQLVIAVANKQLLFPGLVLAACILFEVNGVLGSALLLLSCLPSPPSAYILARQLGGNVSLMANIITVQTLVAFIMIPVWIELAERFL